jgi:hypothetical protein
MSEDSARFWSVVFGGITAIGLIAGGAYTLVQFLDSRARDREAKEKEAATYALQVATAQLEARKPFYSKHLDLCSEASTAAGTIATIKDPRKKKTAVDDFWRLYWGPLGMVEEDEVASAMVAFGECLDTNCKHGLRPLSLALAHGCRAEVSRHFELNLPPPRKLSGKTSAD